MPWRPLLPRLQVARGALVRCRGCLGPAGPGAVAGLCARCWEGLVPLPEDRCPRCALSHGEPECPEPVAWALGDALWAYAGGRPPLGALLLPAIKQGEDGWRRALLERMDGVPLPPWAAEVDAVTAAPPSPHRRWLRGRDLAEAAARQVAARLDRPFRPLLAKGWFAGRQAARTESERRRLPRAALRVRPGARPAGCLLLVDDVWTTGTTLLRGTQALLGAGAEEVRVLTLFRAL